MIWIDYNIESFPNGNFVVRGDTLTEVMDKGLYKPGDVFVVDSNGVLCKTDKLSTLIEMYDRRKNEM